MISENNRLMHEAQEKKRLERKAAADAEQAHRVEIHKLEQERLAEEWEAGRPEREAAERELVVLRFELSELEGPRNNILARMRQLNAIRRPPPGLEETQ
jgi:hypothetical protein